MRQLTQLQAAAGILEERVPDMQCPGSGENVDPWENIADESGADDEDLSTTANPTDAGEQSGEAQKWILVLPLNRNADSSLGAIELEIRIEQATSQLNHLRDKIAKKSFQYSHVIREGKKPMKLRLCVCVHEINHQIALHLAIYSKCRKKLITLRANAKMLTHQFKELKKEDVKASTAILKPNIPGSTKLKLSWIWHGVRTCLAGVSDGPGEAVKNDPATQLECE